MEEEEFGVAPSPRRSPKRRPDGSPDGPDRGADPSAPGHLRADGSAGPHGGAERRAGEREHGRLEQGPRRARGRERVQRRRERGERTTDTGEVQKPIERVRGGGGHGAAARQGAREGGARRGRK